MDGWMDGWMDTITIIIISSDHIQFQQASLSHAVPNFFQIFLTHDKNLLPDDVISDVKRTIHVWIITDNQWREIYLPVYIIIMYLYVCSTMYIHKYMYTCASMYI